MSGVVQVYFPKEALTDSAIVPQLRPLSSE